MQTVFDDTLTKNTNLMVRMNELQTAQCLSLTYVSREVKVDCVEHFVVGNTPRFFNIAIKSSMIYSLPNV